MSRNCRDEPLVERGTNRPPTGRRAPRQHPSPLAAALAALAALVTLVTPTGCQLVAPYSAKAADLGHDAKPGRDGSADLRVPPDASATDATRPGDIAAADVQPAGDGSPDGSAASLVLWATHDNTLLELALDGRKIASSSIPYPGGRTLSEDARDLTAVGTSQVAVFNGTFRPYLSVASTATGSTITWKTHRTATNWSVANNTSYGGLTAGGGVVYAADMQSGNDATGGVIAFSGSTFAPKAYVGDQHIDLNVGQNGKLYGLHRNGTDVDLLGLPSPTKVGEIKLTSVLSSTVRAVAVDANGTIYGAGWDGNAYRFSASGARIDKLALGAGPLIDVDLNGSLLAFSSSQGKVVLVRRWKVARRITIGVKPVFIALAPALTSSP